MKKIIYTIAILLFPVYLSGQSVFRFNGTGNSDDMSYTSAIDASGNMFIGGKSKGSGSGFDYSIVKYNSWDLFNGSVDIMDPAIQTILLPLLK
ncbi:MAG: hypothetical protein IPM96_14175 [Ignavibacteria bacterium]|nr:hypothetical protein [Ignavibacteria bacterium]